MIIKQKNGNPETVETGSIGNFYPIFGTDVSTSIENSD